MPTQIIDSYSESHLNAGLDIDGRTIAGIAQGITGDGRTLDEVQWYLYTIANPIGNCYAKLYHGIGVWGTNFYPTGVPIAMSDPVGVSTLSKSDHVLSKFYFSTPYKLIKGTHYCISLEFLSYYIQVGSNIGSPNPAGNNSELRKVGSNYYWGGSDDNGEFIFYAISNEMANESFEITCTNEQKVRVTVNPVTSKGLPTVLDGPVVVTVQSGDGTGQMIDDTNFYVISGSNPGDTMFLVSGDADLGNGVETISALIILHVEGAKAQNLGLSANMPELK